MKIETNAEILPNISRSRLAASTCIAALAFTPLLSTSAEAAVPCPKPAKIKQVSEGCKSYLMKVLKQSVYDDLPDASQPYLNHAVLTYQKLANNGLVEDGVLGPLTARSILSGIGLSPPSPDPQQSGAEVYIDKSDQVMYFLRNGVVKNVFSVSTGTEQAYPATYKTDPQSGVRVKVAEAGIGDTPTGLFSVQYKAGPNEEGPLGKMPFANYFRQGGFAIHAGYVDANGRDSHGCVRVNPQTMINIVNPRLKIGTPVKIVE